jgi:nucleoside-diphosphate-sugar epimerase
MKILVTGAAGFIGSHLAEALLGRGHEVVGLDNFNGYYDRALKERNAASVRDAGGVVLELDLAGDELSAPLDGVEVVFHAAAQPGLSPSTSDSDYERNNGVATQRLIAACSAAGSVEMLFYLSTSSVYGAMATSDEQATPAPTSTYGRTKLAAEQAVLAASSEGRLRACALRIFSVYGPRERPEKLYPLLIASIKTGRPFPLFDGALEHERSFTYVGDIVEGLLAALEHRERLDGEVINLGSERSASTATGIRIVEELMGSVARFDPKPARAGDQLKTAAKIGKARSLLGYSPQTELRDGLAAEVEWFCSER